METSVRSAESYYLIMVIASFAVFGVVLAANTLKYSGWLKHQPVKKG